MFCLIGMEGMKFLNEFYEAFLTLIICCEVNKWFCLGFMAILVMIEIDA